MSEPPSPPKPVQPIEYVNARTEHRPGLLTAIGIVSIIVACLSALASCSGIFSSIGMLMMHKFSIHTPPVSAATVPATRAATTVPVVTAPFLNVPPAASILTMIEDAMSLCLAVLLLIAGILVLRDSASALRAHWLYVIVKIPLAILGAIAAWFTTSAMMGSVYANMGSAAPPPMFRNWMAAIQVVFVAGFSLAYPVALIIVLSLSGTRSYYGRLRESRTQI